MTDWVPEIMQAGARMRGAWLWQSDALPNAIDGMVWAPYRAGAKLLVANGTDIRVVPTDSIGSTSIGTIPATKQNPIFYRDRVIVPAADGTTLPRYIAYDGTNYTLTNAPAAALPGKYATAWKDRLVLGGSATYPYRVAYMKPGDPTAAPDAISIVDTAEDLTGLAFMRNQVLAFHGSSVERLRGTTPPDSTLSDPVGDLILDSLFDRAGCYDARSIQYWNENVLFCDVHGVHLTDGAATRNLVEQAGVMNLWRDSWERPVGTPPLTTAAIIHRDYYIVTIRHTGYPPVTFAADLSTRRAFMLANVDATAFGGVTGTRERLFGVDASTKRVTDLTPMFRPNPAILQVDANGQNVLPVIATAWVRLSKEPSMKRILDVHLAYEAYVTTGDPDVFRLFYVNAPTGADQALGEFKSTAKFRRRKMAVRRRLEGVGFRLIQLVPTKDSRLYDLSLRAYAEEDQRL